MFADVADQPDASSCKTSNPDPPMRARFGISVLCTCNSLAALSQNTHPPSRNTSPSYKIGIHFELLRSFKMIDPIPSSSVSGS